MKVTSRVEKITPKDAERHLKNNDLNRRVKQALVKRYVAEMSRGRWALTGEPIIFDGESLLNGQHRLLACIEAKKPFETLVVRGIDRAHFTKMDCGSRRSAADVLSIKGFSQGNQIAAATRVIRALHEVEEGGSITRIRWAKHMAHDEILAFVSDNADMLYECSSVVLESSAKAILRPPSTFIGLYFYLCENNEARADDFFKLLATGENLSGGSPIYRLRAILIKDAAARHKRRGVPWKVAVTIKAWNHWMAGERPKTLTFSEDEMWPKIAARKAGK